MSNDKHQRDTRAGIDRMAQHAREMHASGKLSQGELRDLAKWLITKGAETLSMEEYVQDSEVGRLRQGVGGNRAGG